MLHSSLGVGSPRAWMRRALSRPRTTTIPPPAQALYFLRRYEILSPGGVPHHQSPTCTVHLAIDHDDKVGRAPRTHPDTPVPCAPCPVPCALCPVPRALCPPLRATPHGWSNTRRAVPGKRPSPVYPGAASGSEVPRQPRTLPQGGDGAVRQNKGSASPLHPALPLTSPPNSPFLPFCLLPAAKRANLGTNLWWAYCAPTTPTPTPTTRCARRWLGRCAAPHLDGANPCLLHVQAP